MLEPGAELRVVAWSQEAIRLELKKGRLRSDVHRRSPTEVYEVRTETVSARVVGTTFTVDLGADGSSSVSVEHGVVAATGTLRARHLRDPTGARSGRPQASAPA